MKQISNALAMVPAIWRHRIYLAARLVGVLVFVVAAGLKFTGHESIHGVTIDPETGVIALVLAALSQLAHANLTSVAGVVAAVESTSPQVAVAVKDAEDAAPAVAPIIEKAVQSMAAVETATAPAAPPMPESTAPSTPTPAPADPATPQA